MEQNEMLRIIRLILRDEYGLSPRLIEAAVGRLEAEWEKDGNICKDPVEGAERLAQRLSEYLNEDI